MRKLLIILSCLISLTLNAQYSVIVNDVHYFPDLADGTDITARLQDTIDICVDNDVIILPAGKFIITGFLELSIWDVSIIGRGADSTNGTFLYRNAYADDKFFRFWNSQDVSEYPVFMSGIYMKGRKSEVFGGSHKIDPDWGASFQNRCNWYFTDNAVENTGYGGVMTIQSHSLLTGFTGLIFDNRFINVYRPEIGNYGYGVSVGTADLTWIADPEFGSNKFVFIEDNLFHENRHPITSGGGGKYVFRHNTLEDCYLASMDMHGGGGPDTPIFGNILSARASEQYYNSVINTKYPVTVDGELRGLPITSGTTYSQLCFGASVIRGGEALIYNNDFQGYMAGVYLWLEDQTPGSYPSAYPNEYQIGYNSGLVYGYTDTGYTGTHGDGDVFAWNNTATNTWVKAVVDSIENDVGNDDDVNFIQEGRDYQTVAKPGYTAYTYPHPYRNYYYSFIDEVNTALSLSTSDLGDNTVTLTWNDALLEDGYYIYKSTNGVNFTKEPTSVGMNITTTQISGLFSGTQYWFYIVPYNDTHEGESSDTETITTTGTTYNLNGDFVFDFATGKSVWVKIGGVWYIVVN